MSYQVFISHSSKDSEIARDLARRLKEAGARVSVVTEGLPASGDFFSSSIYRSLRAADEVVLLLTNNSLENPNVMYEFGVAYSLDKRVTSVVVNEEVEKRVPMLGKQFIKYADLPRYISSLKKRIQAAA